MTLRSRAAGFARSRTAVVVALAAIGLALAAWAWHRHAAPTRVAFVNFQEFQLARIERARPNRFVRVDDLPLDQLSRARRYPAVFVFGRGLALNDEQRAALARAERAGTRIYVEGATDPTSDVTNIEGRDLEYVGGYFRYGGSLNYGRLLTYVRRSFEAKRLWTGDIQPPHEIGRDVFFHLGDENIFTSLAAFAEWARRTGVHTGDRPRIALATSVPGPFNASRDHVDAFITALAGRGYDVYPMAASARRLEFLQQVEPDLVVFMPHGRLTADAGDAAIAWLRERNIPMLSPLSVFMEHGEWVGDQQGMDGGLLSMSVVLPELDGGIVPYAVAAQYRDEEGYLAFKAIPERLERFCDLVDQWVALRTRPNHEKRIAIYYFKGPGNNALTASNLEVLPSLYHLLGSLRDQGYDVAGLPATEDAFAALVMRHGPVLGPYARGAFEEFLETGDPALVATEDYEAWVRRDLEPDLYADVLRTFGPPPGDYMAVARDGRDYLAVARLQFGNVAILPQPLAGLGDDTFAIVHGTKKAPPHTYIGSYLWTRNTFRADAIVHLGTHGSLEFTPWKQVALSGMDWPDALIGAAPHFYVYITSNVGEGIIAKRRSYATTVTHLTPPFKESGVYSDLARLRDLVLRLATAPEGPVRAEYALSVAELAGEMGMDKDLGLPPERASWSEADLTRLSDHVENLAHEKIASGLYTWGRGYTPDKAASTALLMALDPVAYAMARLDLEEGRVTQAQVDDAVSFDRRYRQRARSLIERVQRGAAPEDVLAGVLPAGRAASARAWQESVRRASAEAPARGGRGGRPAGAASPRPDGGHGDAPQGDPRAEAHRAVLMLADTLEAVSRYRAALDASPGREVAGLINALNGGYVEPQSGGDPIGSPAAVPSGRNLYSIDAERTPSAQAWAVGVKLADSLLARHVAAEGQYPRKVAFTLWPSDFISTEGATVAQALYLLGVEPVRDPLGRVVDIRVIPAGRLGRPRIDVVVQTAGQFRDIAASRLYLINKAVRMAAALEEGDEANYVRTGAAKAEDVLKAQGLSPADARALSTMRVFGGVNGNYGTDIMGLVEAGDRWESEGEVAQRYLANMGAMYDEGERWSAFTEGVFEAALQDTDVVVQPRESYTWGPLSLDHVYEFMGGLSMAARHVTGRDPSAYFSDFRNAHNPRMTELTETVWTEARATLLNPSYIRDLTEGGASSAEKFAETFRNTYGWNVMKPAAIDSSLWDRLYETYVDDQHQLGLRGFFERENPYALQEMSAVMLETARKGYWKATEPQLRSLAELHAELVRDHAPGCSGFVCDNAKLRDLIASHLDPEMAAEYRGRIEAVREGEPGSQERIVLERESRDDRPMPFEAPVDPRLLLLAGIALLLFIAWFVRRRRREAEVR